MFYTYILPSMKTDAYDIGHTEAMNERLRQHNQGLCRSTKHAVPWKAVHVEEFETRSEAIKRER